MKFFLTLANIASFEDFLFSCCFSQLFQGFKKFQELEAVFCELRKKMINIINLCSYKELKPWLDSIFLANFSATIF